MITDPVHLIAAAVLFGVALALGYLHGRRDGYDIGYATGYRRGQAETEQEAARELPQLLAHFGIRLPDMPVSKTDRAA